MESACAGQCDRGGHFDRTGSSRGRRAASGNARSRGGEMIGRVVGQYKILEPLGEGGMGSVYKAIDLMLDRPVAIKTVRCHWKAAPGAMERFRSEATLVARLNHPSICTLYAFFREGDEFFMVMELIEG